MRLRELVRALRRQRYRLGLGRVGLVALLCGTGALIGSVVVFGGATEDVTQHNGQALEDARRLRFFVDHRSDVLVRAAKVVTEVGAVAVLAALAIVAGVVLWRRGLRLVVALAPSLALSVAAIGVAIVKSVVDRARPPVALHLVSESDASFPSGHATDSAAVLLTIALALAVYVLRRPIARVLCVVGAGLLSGAIGASRLVLGVHWPTDVLAGWAFGIGVALAVTMTTSLVARLTPPSTALPAGRIRRFSRRVAQWLTLARRPRGDLPAV